MPASPKPPPGLPGDPGSAALQAEHKRLAAEIQSMQSVLVRLLQDLVDAETSLDETTAAQLVEANGQLILAALASQEQAETVSQALLLAARAPALDALTHLPTRSTLFDRFSQAMAQARRHHQGLALLFVDLDEFKPLNDSFGHAFGDQVLCQVAQRLGAAVREVDTVSRHGGDEFLILLAALSDPADAQAVADKLTATLAMPMTVEGRTLNLSASIGVARFPEDGDDLDTLTARADAAMYASKRRRHQRTARPGGAQPSDPAAAPGGGSPRSAAADPAEAERLLQLTDLREANERLVLAATGAQELQAAAEAALQRQGRFIRSVADELRDPTAPVHVAAAMLGRQSGDEPLLPRVKALVEQRLARMAQRVASLLEATAAESGNLVLHCREVDLATLVDAAVVACKPLMRRRRLRLHWRRPPIPIRLMADPEYLQLAISNLLDSACSHTSMGGAVAITLGAEADRAVLRLDDEGIGIPPEMLPHVFEPFVMDDRALDIHGASLGIGLTVARALGLAHGGWLEACSLGTGRGSSFVLTLPMGATQAAGGAAKGAHAAIDAATDTATPAPTDGSAMARSEAPAGAPAKAPVDGPAVGSPGVSGTPPAAP
jgi:diguanylate cyclase